MQEKTGNLDDKNTLVLELEKTRAELEKLKFENIRLRSGQDIGAESASTQRGLKYSGLFEQLQDGIFRLDLESRIMECNPAFKDMIGYAYDELAGKTIWDITPQKWHQQQLEIMKKVLADGYSGVYEKEYLRKDETVIPVAVNSILIRDSWGNPIGMWGTVRDMTRWKETEKALEKSLRELRAGRQRYELAVEGAGLASWEWDTISRDANIDERWAAMLGYTLDKVRPVVDTWEKHLYHEDKDRVLKALWDMIEGRSDDFDIEYRMTTKDSRTIWVHSKGRAIERYPNGRAVSIAGINRDVTEHVEAELALRQSEMRFRQMFENVNSAAALSEMIMSPDGRLDNLRFLNVNSMFEEVVGKSRAEIEGRFYSEIFPSPERNHVFDIYERVMLTQKPFHGEVYSPALSGYYNMTIYIPGPGQLAVFFYDVTSRVEAEQELRKQQETIKAQNEVLIAQNEELRVMQGELERGLNELKTAQSEISAVNAELQQFAYVASHDLQEPLRMIASYLQLIERRYRDKLDSDGKEFIAFAVDGAKRLQSLIISLLEYSRIETQGAPFESVSTQLIIDDVLKLLKVPIEENDAVIKTGNLPQVSGDPAQLTRLFQNLILNSLKFRDNNYPYIEIGAVRQGNYWRFHVKDNGIGIEPKYFDRIFVIFQRLNGHEYPGTGIGLSISKRIVERHGGKIWVESGKGTGTTFYFTLHGVKLK